MFRHLLISSFRFLKKYRSISVICIITAVLGMLGTLPFAEGIWGRSVKDRFYENGELLYQVSHKKLENNAPNLPNDKLPTSEDILSYFPDVEKITWVHIQAGFAKQVVSAPHDNGTYTILKEDVMRTNDDFFRIIPLDFITGFDPNWFSEPGKAILSESSALGLFGTTDVIGKEIIINYDKSYNIVALHEPPDHSSFSMGIIVSHWEPSSNWNIGKQGWLDKHLWLVKFNNPPDEEYLFDRARALSEDVFPADSKALLTVEPFPGPLELDEGFYIESFFIFILLFAVVGNYINLSAGFALNIAKELGIRRIVGSGRLHLAYRVILQNLILLLFAVIVGLAAYRPFTGLIDSPMSITMFTLTFSLIVMGVILLFSVLIPTILLSRIHPQDALKGNPNTIKIGRLGKTRFSLVSMQLAASTILLTLFSIIFLNYYDWVSRPLNWDTERLYTVGLGHSDSTRTSLFYERIRNTGIVEDLSYGSSLPIGGYTFRGIGIKTAQNSDQVGGDLIHIDENYFNTLNLDLLEGSFEFQRSFTPIWVSRSFAEKLTTEDLASLAGQHVDYFTNNSDSAQRGYIAGVVQDCQSGPLNKKGLAKAFVYESGFRNNLIIKYRKDSESDLGSIEVVFKEIFPNRMYTGKKVGKEQLAITDFGVDLALGIFSFWAIFGLTVMFLGLYGIMINIAVHRKKEFSLRRVFGSSLSGIARAVLEKISVILVLGILLGSSLGFLLFTQLKPLLDLPVTDHLIHYLLPVLLIITVVLTIVITRVRIIVRDNPSSILNSE